MNSEASAYALRLLGQRSYTTHDLRKKLVTKEFPVETIEQVLERFTASGLLDDKRFAMSFARSRLTGASASPRKVRQLLVRKGISQTFAAQAVEQVIQQEEIDTEATLRKVAKKRLENLSGLEPLVQRRRLYGFLARRGYDLDEIQRVVTKLLATERAL
ncbi:MAG: regulatory protein RecX [Gemmatimonadaceae bacterium]|nr:regulatory protein RecX [Gemmatimonadaceae bacterium]